MEVSGRHIAAVRALLVGDEHGWLRLIRELQEESSESQRSAESFLMMVFVRATRRRFGSDATHRDVIRYVSEARTDGALSGEALDVRVTERLLLGALGDDDAVHGLTANDTAVIGLLMVDLVRRELELDEPGIDELLKETRQRTERRTARLSA